MSGPGKVYDLEVYRLAAEETTELPVLRAVPEPAAGSSTWLGPLVIALIYLTAVALLCWIALGK